MGETDMRKMTANRPPAPTQADDPNQNNADTGEMLIDISRCPFIGPAW
jgi:hypothetical protein